MTSTQLEPPNSTSPTPPPKDYPAVVQDGPVPVSPAQKDGDLTHTTPDQVPIERRARWIRAHPQLTGGS